MAVRSAYPINIKQLLQSNGFNSNKGHIISILYINPIPLDILRLRTMPQIKGKQQGHSAFFGKDQLLNPILFP